MKRKITVTISDYHRIVGLIEMAALKSNMPKGISEFYAVLQNARLVHQDDIDDQIVTMHSRVLLKELGTGRETEVSVNYPQDAVPGEKKISVFSTIGIALFGRKAKDVVSWKIPTGTGLFEIVKVTYQPEAAGDYYL